MQFDEFVMQNALSSYAMVQWLCNVDIPHPPHIISAFIHIPLEKCTLCPILSQLLSSLLVLQPL